MPTSRSRSQAHFERAARSIPGGVNSPARAFGAVGGQPLIIDHADGAFLYDIDGNRLIDYIGSWGPHILGHRHPEVTKAIHAAVDKGTSFGAPNEMETELAELIKDAVPSIELVRMVSSGTEATMSAIRVARGFTGRDLIVKFAGCYHGHVDSLLVKAGSGALTHGNPSSPGVPKGCTNDTLVLEYNHADQLEAAFQAHPGKIACVILEPVVGNMGTVLPAPGYLETLRRLCTEHGTVLLFDEVMTGFRVAFGGAQERYSIRPDMTTLGKIVGGGMPVGAYGGRADIMKKVSPVGPVYQAGTLSGNPVAMAAGIATLKSLKSTNPYPQLEAATQRLCAGLADAAKSAGVPYAINQVASMWTLFFADGPITDLATAMRSDTKRFGQFFWGLIDRGVYLACSQFEANFVSTRHTNELIDETIAAGKDTLNEIAKS